MRASTLVLAALLASSSLAAGAGQPLTVSERLVQLADVLGKQSTFSSRQKIQAIDEIGRIRTISGLAESLLFQRGNPLFEPDPLVREAAALNLQYVCEPSNRRTALRLARFATPANEPDSRVRSAALRSLASFQTSEAAQKIYDATEEIKEPDAEVRAVASALIQKGLAAAIY